ncbi:MAG: phage tail protein [Clostridia bacterium]|nr:phage tail protein [Clostridia bacterium]
MPKRILTRDGDMLDDIVWRHYGRQDVVPAVLETNQDLSLQGPVLPAGMILVLPDVPVPADAPVIRLWS